MYTTPDTDTVEIRYLFPFCHVAGIPRYVNFHYHGTLNEYLGVLFHLVASLARLFLKVSHLQKIQFELIYLRNCGRQQKGWQQQNFFYVIAGQTCNLVMHVGMLRLYAHTKYTTLAQLFAESLSYFSGCLLRVYPRAQFSHLVFLL